MVEANNVLYKEGEHPDHTVVIKYMPAVGDSKRALDEYHGEIFMGGHQTISWVSSFAQYIKHTLTTFKHVEHL